MMRRAWTAVGLSCVVVATTVAGIEDPSVKKTGATTRAVDTTTTSKDLDRRLPSELSVADIDPLMQLARDAANRNAPGNPFARPLPDQEMTFNLDALAEAMSQPARSAEVRPAIVVPKKPTAQLQIPLDPKTGEDRATGRVKFKFNNALKARASLVPGQRIVSLVGADIRSIEEIISRHRGTVRQLIQKSPQDLSFIENKAFQHSNRIQPDMASMMVVEFPSKNLDVVLSLARELNEEPSIEWVTIDRQIDYQQEDVAGCNPDNPDFCNEPSRVEERDGPIGGDPFKCWSAAKNPVTGQPSPGLLPGMCNPDPGCEMEDSPCIYGCSDIGCCQQVGGLLPYCIEEDSINGWDTLCAAVANLICAPSIYAGADDPNLVYDACLSTFQYPDPVVPWQQLGEENFNPNPVFDNARQLVLGPCTEPQTFAGCTNTKCCVMICYFDQACCTQAWDITCANLANNNTDFSPFCLEVEPPAPTPKFTSQKNPDLGITVGSQAWMVPEAVTNRLDPPNGPGNQGQNAQYGDHTVLDYIWSTNVDAPAGTPGEPQVDSSFLLSGFTGGGFDVPGVERLMGTLWANYGAGGNSDNQVLPHPTKVWLYGRQFELVSSASGCRGVDQAYDCDDCYHNNPIAQDGRYMGDRFPHFVEGASTLDPNTGLQPTSMLCPTGEVLGGAVIEFAAYVNHEEFLCEQQSSVTGQCTSNYDQPRVISEPGQTVLLVENSVNQPNHGTACLGIMVAGDNGFGVRGMASEAQGWFFPTVSLEEGDRTETAISSAIQYLNPGSVINMSMGFGGGNVMTSDEAIYALVAVASDALIAVCESAGNDGEEVTGEAGEGSGAIIVGAQSPGALLNSSPFNCDFYIQSRMATCFWASNWSEDGLVPVCAWGTSVASIGYGDLYRGSNPPSPGGEELERNNLRTYTGPGPGNGGGGFSGTSAAAPQMSGAALWMQSFAHTFYGQFLTSAQVGAVLSSAMRTTCSSNLGNDIDVCWDYDPEQQVHPIGGMPALFDCGLNVLVRLGADFNGKITIYTGTHAGGNTFSLGEVDGNTFRVRSELAAQGPGPDGLGYLGSGNTVDFGIVFDTGYDPTDVMNARIDIDCTATGAGGPGIILMIPWVKDQVSQRYMPLAVELLTATMEGYVADLGLYITPQSFFDSAGRVDARFYTLNLGYLGAPSYTSSWDRLELVVNDPNAPNDP